VYAVREDAPDSGASLIFPASLYELLDMLDKLRLDVDSSVKFSVNWYYCFNSLATFLYGPNNLYGPNALARKLSELNALAEKLSELDNRQAVAFEGLLKMEWRSKKSQVGLPRIIDLAYSTDCCHVVDEALNDAQLGRFCAENGFVPGMDTLPDALFEMLDFERIGQEHRQSEGGVLVKRTEDHPGGYVERHSDLVEAYKTLDLEPKIPDYSLLLHVARGYYAPPASDCEQAVRLKLPASRETLEAVLSALKVDDWKETVWYGLDCRAPTLADMIYDIGVNDEFDGPWMERLNRLARQLADMTPQTLNAYKALLEVAGCKDIQGAEQLVDTMDEYILSPQFSSPIDVANGELSAALTWRDAALLTPHLNLNEYGQSLIQRCGGQLTDYGLIKRKDGQPVQAIEDQPRQMGGMSFE